ncbi:unnamed protein product [Phytomonas sp. Hart1]|nr:unnamed protein product [Phytomonas sp. Hart1]|eukprot:CCW66604.1 unnamed protein product [Phytomonas sp. isolate Hart1]
MLPVVKIRKRSKSPNKLRQSDASKSSFDSKLSKRDKQSISSNKKSNSLLSLHRNLHKTEKAASKFKAATYSQASKRPSLKRVEGDKAKRPSYRSKESIDLSLRTGEIKIPYAASENLSRRSSVASKHLFSKRSSVISRKSSSRISSKQQAQEYSDLRLMIHRRTLPKDKPHDICPSLIPLMSNLSPCHSTRMEADFNQQEGTMLSLESEQSILEFDPNAPLSTFITQNIDKIRASLNKQRLPTRSVRDLQSELAQIEESCPAPLNHDQEIRRMAREAGVELTGPWLTPTHGYGKNKRTSSGIGNYRLDDLSAGNLIRIFCFCDSTSLVELNHACKRFHVLSGSREVMFGRDRKDLCTAFTKNRTSREAKKGLLNNRDQMRKEEEEEMVVWKAMYKNLKKNMDERVIEEHARKLPASVEGLFGKQHPEARTHAKRCGLNLVPSRKFFDFHSNRNTSELKGDDDGEVLNHDAYSTQKLWTQIKEIEATREELINRIQQNNERVSLQKTQLQELQHRIFSCRIEDNTTENDNLPAPKTASPCENVFEDAYLTFEDLEHFERRMVLLILNGRGGAAEVESIPLVLRRGIESFASLELLLSNPLLFNANDESGGIEHAEAPKASSWRVIHKRWLMFKSFFPLNDNGYYTARRCLIQCAMNGTDKGPSMALNKRHEKVLLRFTGVLRRVKNMRDSEVLDVIM